VHTLDEKCIELAYLLSTDEKAKLGGVGLPGRKETVAISEHVGDVGSLYPYVTEEVPLGTNGDCDFVTGVECANVIHTLRLYGKVRMALVVLSEERHLGITRDIGILGTLGDKINQCSRHLLINDIKNWRRRCSK